MSALIDRAAAGFAAGVVMTAGIVAITGISWSSGVAPALEPAPAPAMAPEPVATPAPSPKPAPDDRDDLQVEDPGDKIEVNPFGRSLGLPAISADRETIAMLFSHDDGGRGWENLHLRFHRASDGAVIAELPLLEAEEMGEPGDRPRPGLERKARARAAAAQKKLRGFEPLVKLADGPDFKGRYLGMKLDVYRDTVIVRDDATDWPLLHAAFPVDAPEPNGDDVCAATDPTTHAIYMTPDREMLVSSVTYMAGPCWCDGETLLYARPLGSVPRSVRERQVD